MNRRAFLIGAAAAPLAAPAIAAAAAKPGLIGMDFAKGGTVSRGALYIVGEQGIEYLVPSSAWTAKTADQIMADIGRACRGLQDGGTFSISLNDRPTREPAV